MIHKGLFGALSLFIFADDCVLALTPDEIAQIETDLAIQLSTDQIDQLDAIVNPSNSEQWRTDAYDRIEQHRKADLQIEVVDAYGVAIEGAQVEVKLRKSNFKFGGVVHAHDLDDARGNLSEGGATSDEWEQIVKGLFNALGTGNNFKPRLAGLHGYLPHFLDWAGANDFDVRGHLLIWPGSGGIEDMDEPGSVINQDYGKHFSEGFPESLHSVPGYEDVVSYDVQQAVLDYKASGRTQADKDTLEAVVDAEIEQWAGLWDVYEWDVINETINNRVLMDIMGYDQMAEWFKIAEENKVNPDCKLLINDYQIISAMDDPNAPQWANYANRRDTYMANIDRILADGGPLDRIGFQSRYKFGKPDPEITYSRLKEWSDKYGREMVGTEFEVVDNPSGGFAYDFSEQERAEITEQTMTVYYSHPLVTGFFCWTFMQSESHEEGEKALAYYDGSVKLNGLVWYYLHRIRFATDESGATDSAGRMNLRGFKGDYDGVVTYDGKDYPVTFRLSEDSTVKVQLEDVQLYTASEYYEDWIAGHSGLEREGLSDNSDGDLHSNLEEYAFGGDPTNYLKNGYLPEFRLLNEAGSEYLEYVYVKRVDASARGLIHELQHSTSLAPNDWVVVSPAGKKSIEGDAGFEEVTSRIPATEGAKSFVRLRTRFEP